MASQCRIEMLGGLRADLGDRTIDRFRTQLTKKSSAEDQKAIEAGIRGMEKKQLPHLLCTTNLMLNGIDVPSQIEHRNTLARAWNETPEKS